MPGSRSPRTSLALLLLAPALCAAESAQGTGSVSARLNFAIVVPPVFRVLEVTRTPEGLDYRVWTNTKSVHLGGREYRFDRVGETVLKVPVATQHGSHAGVTIVQGL